VQIQVIDINDQIPIFEKSDVSTFNTIFDVPVTFDKCLSMHSMSVECQWENNHSYNKQQNNPLVKIKARYFCKACIEGLPRQ